MMDELERETPPPAALKGRVVASLERRGLLAPPRPRWGAARRIAAAVALLATGAVGGGLLAGGLAGGLGGDAEPSASPGSRYLLVLYEDESFQPDRPVEALVAEYGAWAQVQRSEGALSLGEQLEPGGWMIGDGAPGDAPPDAGPYGDVTGFFVITAPDDAAARDIARSCPHLRYGGRIAVQPISGP